MQVNGDVNFTGTLSIEGRDIKQYLDNHYELGLILIRGLIGGGYIGGTIYDTITTLKYSTDAWATSASVLTQGVKYGGWASAHTAGYVLLNQQDGRTGNNKVIFASETVTAIGNRTYAGSSPSTIQQGVGYESTGVAFGTKAYTCGTESTGYDKLTFSTDTFTSATDSNIPTNYHSVGWFDKEYGYHYAGATNRTAIYPFATESWGTLSTTNTPVGFGFPQVYLEKGLNTKKGKFYLAGSASWYNNTLYQFRNSIATWSVNYGSQTLPNCESAGTMGQNHGYLAGGYQSNVAGGQNAHSDKIYHDTDSVVNIADAPRPLSSGSPMWSSI
jgi:hypothetical protein